MTTAGDIVARRVEKLHLDEAGEYIPGQWECRTMDPHPKRDKADLAAVLSYVDEEKFACALLCIRYRHTGWRAIKTHRSTPKKMGRSTLVVPALEGELLAVLLDATDDVPGFPYAAPSADELAIRRCAVRLWESAGGEVER